MRMTNTSISSQIFSEHAAVFLRVGGWRGGWNASRLDYYGPCNSPSSAFVNVRRIVNVSATKPKLSHLSHYLLGPQNETRCDEYHDAVGLLVLR